MEKTKREIDDYLEKNIKELYDKKMKAGTNIFKIKEQSNSVIKFMDKFSFDIDSIIFNNGIKNEDEIAELKSYANKIVIDRLGEYAPIIGL
jgi:hypothetical protein